MWSHYGDKHKGVCLGFEVPRKHAVAVTYLETLQVVGDLRDIPKKSKIRILDRLNWAKHNGWSYEKEVRVKGSREDMDEETGKYFVNFSEHLKLREVIAGARFQMSKRPIEDALEGYPEDVDIVKACSSKNGFRIVIDKHGFD